MARMFERYESKVRVYCEAFKANFETADNAFIYDDNRNKYIDFFSGAGSLNYGHNNKKIKKALIKYIEGNGITQSLDMTTPAKEKFINKFQTIILKPRGLEYKMQFVGPTGADAVEAALKLSKIVTKRRGLIAFTNSFHGCTAGSLAVSASTNFKKNIRNANVDFMPYDGYIDNFDSINYMEKMLTDSNSGIAPPAAIILETIQAEGGINVAESDWLKRLEKLCKKLKTLLIIDDIQVGNGRTGTFFSFEKAGIYPDMILLSKSIGGYGLPLSIVLLKPHLDMWKSGEHTGTFRGNNLAFIAGTEALDYWKNETFSNELKIKSEILYDELDSIAKKTDEKKISVRGRGFIYGLDLIDSEFAVNVASRAFEKKLIIERCGKGEVLKFMPPLTIETDTLMKGIDIIKKSIAEVCIAN